MIDDVVTGALEGYAVERELGRGAMGEVLGGRHLRLDRSVAIKRLPDGFAADPEVRRRFGAEARVLASLDHPHVVPVYDYVEREGLCLLVMQALPGGTVWDRFCGDGLSMASAAAVAVATCAGLQHAHARKVLHRDVKPENLMFDDARTLKVTDFGIAAVLGGEGTLATAGGEVVGTPAYMAPEQADGSTVGPAADVYAVATMLYELLSGRLPFSEEGDALDLLRRRLDEEPAPLLEVAPRAPAPMAEVVMAGLAREPAARPATAEEMGVAIARAAVASWGPTWLERTDVRLLAEGAVANAATAPIAAAAATDTVTRGPEVDDRRTLAPGEGAASRRAAETLDGRSTPSAEQPPAPVEERPADVGPTPPPDGPVAPPVEAAPPDEVRRATRTERAKGADLRDLTPEDVVPVKQAIGKAPLPWGLGVVALALAGAAAVVGLTGVGATEPELTAEPGQVRVAGVDAAAGPIEIDLGSEIPVVLGQVPEGASTVQLRFEVAGAPAGTSNEQPLTPVEGGLGATLSASSPRVVASGPLTAEAVVRGADGAELAAPSFEIDPDRSPLLTVSGIVTVILAAFAFGYSWSVSAPLRRGRRRISAILVLTGLGALAGLVTVLAAWVLGGAQPSAGAVVPAAALGASAFAVGGFALLGVGRWRRARRRSRRRRT